MATMAYHSYGANGADLSRVMYQQEPRKRRPTNTESSLLNEAENAALFAILGHECVCLSAGVSELLRSSGGKWTRALRGVICLVKDYQRRAYFIRLIDIVTNNCTWEFQMYKGFQAVFYPPHLVTFESEMDSHVYGLNFSSPKEAEAFKDHLDKRYETEKKTVSSKENRSSVPPVPRASIAPSHTLPSSTPSYPRPPSTQPPFMATGVAVPYPPVKSTDTIKSSGGVLFGRKKADKKKRIRKEDISNPTNFQHKAHVGWDEDSGFSNTADPNPLDSTIMTILRAAGQDPMQMSKKDIKFVYEFIENYHQNPNVDDFSSPPMSSRTQQSNVFHSSPAPPPPSRGPSHYPSPIPPSYSPSIPSTPPSRPPPPPPSSNRPSLPRPLPSIPNGRPNEGPPLPPPPPSSLNTSAAPPPPPPPPPISCNAPPPPPPPPPMGGPSPPPSSASNGRGNLLAEIQAGKQLRSVADQVEKKSNGEGGRDDVMAQIRQGTTLRHVDVAEKEKRKSSGMGDVGGLAGALARALEERRVNMGLDDMDDDDSDSDNKSDWSD